MKKNYLSLSVILCLTLSLVSCTKEDPAENLQAKCDQLAQMHAHPFTAVNKGEEITLTADDLLGATYYWSGPNNFQSYSQTNLISSYADYTDRGWYHVKISYDGCDDSIFDSVYVDVKFPQGTPSCSPADNTANFTSGVLLGDQNFSFITFGSGVAGYEITANSPNGDMTLTLSDYWKTHELEDGIYYTTSQPIPDYSAIDQVFISAVNQSIYWVAEPGKQVFVSHTSGKKRLVFCGIDFSGDWGGTLYHASVDAQLTQP